MSPKTKAAPELEAEKTKIAPSLPRRYWIVTRHDWRTGKREQIAEFSTPTYARIFVSALGQLSDTYFSISEDTKA